MRGRRARERDHLLGKLGAQALDPRYAERRVERCREVPGLIEQLEHVEEELGPYRHLHDLGAERLTDARLLHDLGLPHMPRVERLLTDDALESGASGLARHRGAVVARRGRDHAVVSLFGGNVDAHARPPVLERARHVGGFVLHEDPRTVAGLGVGTHQVGEVAKLEQRGEPHARRALDRTDLLQRVPVSRHHALVVECDRTTLEPRVVHAKGGLHDLALAGHHLLVAGRHATHPPLPGMPTVGS